MLEVTNGLVKIAAIWFRIVVTAFWGIFQSKV